MGPLGPVPAELLAQNQVGPASASPSCPFPQPGQHSPSRAAIRRDRAPARRRRSSCWHGFLAGCQKVLWGTLTTRNSPAAATGLGQAFPFSLCPPPQCTMEKGPPHRIQRCWVTSRVWLWCRACQHRTPPSPPSSYQKPVLKAGRPLAMARDVVWGLQGARHPPQGSPNPQHWLWGGLSGLQKGNVDCAWAHCSPLDQ